MTTELLQPRSEEQAREPVGRVLVELRSSTSGLSQREAERRLAVYGPNALPPAKGPSWLRDLAVQLLHPLALLLWIAAGLALLAGTTPVAVAIVVVIALNAVFALVQEHQAQRAVQALAHYLPDTADVVRDRQVCRVSAQTLVPGDVIVVSEGDRVSADARLLSGSVQLDMSMLTGESAPVDRRAGPTDGALALLFLPDLIFSGTLCTAGAGQAVVLATGVHTEIGRIAALSQHTQRETSPLERKVRQVAWLIAGIGFGVGAAFLPLGLMAGLSFHDAVLFAIGLLVANVPEGLLPTITLALAAGVRTLARRGAVVKRLSAVETLGSTTVICTDKTGTLTQNRMTLVALWTPVFGTVRLPDDLAMASRLLPGDLAAALIGGCLASEPGLVRATPNDATEIALADLAQAAVTTSAGEAGSEVAAALFRFDAARKVSSATVRVGEADLLHCVKGAPEVLLDCSERIAGRAGLAVLDGASRGEVLAELDRMSGEGLRLIGFASRPLSTVPEQRGEAEQHLTFLGMIALHDPPRPEVATAVEECHRAGLRVHIVTGDNGRTAAHVARSVGIGKGGLRVVSAAELDALPEEGLDELLASGQELVFARSTPETKLRVADALKAMGEIVAMTGDGVNDAPALHRADIGVAMGLSGTEVAREAATLVLTDDNFASVVTAIRSGRQVFDNVRKFVLYIFAHAVPEIVPFLVFALSGGAVPLPLTVMQILAIDLGTETLPALALGREAAEPGTMDRPPRPRRESVITRELLIRAWLYMGVVSAALVMLAFWFVLARAGWHLGDSVQSSSPLHHAYRQATTAAWAGLVACQVGTAFGARVDRASLRQVGVFSNRLLLWGIAFELAFAAAVIWLPPLQAIFGTEALDWQVLALIAPFPVIVWGVDELRRWYLRRTARPRGNGFRAELTTTQGRSA